MKKLGLVFCFFLTIGEFCFAELSYYPSSFQKQIQKLEIKDEALKLKLLEILESYHHPQPMGGDLVQSDCLNKSCYRHEALSYSQARKVLFGQIHLVSLKNGYGVEDVYCDQIRGPEEFKSRPPRPMTIPNPSIINAEHTWPQSRFSKRFPKQLQKTDLHALYPVYSRVNSSRGNAPFAEVEPVTSQICPASKKGRSQESGRSSFEPPDNHKGNVARALFYFSVRYELPIDAEQEAYLRQWHKLDPVDEKELARNEQIFLAQENRNPFIDFEDLVDSIEDF